MPRYRPIRKYGDTWVIKLNPSDVKDFQLEEGKEVDIESVLMLHAQNKREPSQVLLPCHKLKPVHNKNGK